MVQLRRHEVHGAAVALHAGSERAPMRVQAGKLRQQRRMDVDQPTGVVCDECGRKHTQEARQRHQARGVPVDLGGERRVEGCARGEAPVLDDAGGHAPARRHGKPRSTRNIADDCRNGYPGLEERLQVAATAGDEDDDRHEARSLIHSPRPVALLLEQREHPFRAVQVQRADRHERAPAPQLALHAESHDHAAVEHYALHQFRMVRGRCFGCAAQTLARQSAPRSRQVAASCVGARRQFLAFSMPCLNAPPRRHRQSSKVILLCGLFDLHHGHALARAARAAVVWRRRGGGSTTAQVQHTPQGFILCRIRASGRPAEQFVGSLAVRFPDDLRRVRDREHAASRKRSFA